jgi:prepilin-type N-terminal cleavage/methylation domain-containing protein
MKFPEHRSDKSSRGRFAQRCAFTLMEVLVASSIAGTATVAALVFMNFARISVSGIMAQAKVSDSAARAIAHIQSRIRVATSITADASGNTLTLGFDDDYSTDSDGDGVTYNDHDHYETFQFIGTNGTNSITALSNRLVYTPKVGVAGRQDLLSSGVRNLPGYNIFSVPYPGTVVIRFGVVDSITRDRFQGIDIQATGLSLNRPASSSVVGVLP